MKRYNILSMGGGTQSSAMALMSLNGKMESFDAMIFADTGDETRGTLQNVRIISDLCQASKIPFVWIKDDSHNIVTSSEGRSRWVSIPFYTDNEGKMPRHCTQEFKLSPIRGATLDFLESKGWVKRNSLGRRRVKNGVRVTSAIGFTIEEFGRIKNFPQPAWISNSYPLIDHNMTKEDCINILNQSDLHFSTDGSACKRCPFVADKWVSLLPPDEVEQILAFDQFLKDEYVSVSPKRYTYACYMTNQRIRLKDVKYHDTNNSCSEMCFT